METGADAPQNRELISGQCPDMLTLISGR